MSFRILKNYKIKIVVVVFAVFIWFFVVTENDYEYVIEVPVNLVNIPHDKVILNELPNNAKVKIKGSGKTLIALSVGRGVRLDLDLSDVERSKTFFLDPEKDVFLSGFAGTIEPEEIISPDSISVILDDLQNKKILVNAKIKAKTAPGYTIVGEVKINPDSVNIAGPKSIVSQIDKIFTQEVGYSDIKFDLNETVPLAALPSDKLNASVKQVDISLNIQKLLEITINEVPVEVRNAPKNTIVHVVPSALSLVLEGGGDLLNSISRDDIVAYIDYARVKNAPGNEHPAYIETPPGISYRDVKPKLFKLVLERRSSN
ncbi:MAG: YbbR-like domain-containing protein [bacterium]